MLQKHSWKRILQKKKCLLWLNMSPCVKIVTQSINHDRQSSSTKQTKLCSLSNILINEISCCNMLRFSLTNLTSISCFEPPAAAFKKCLLSIVCLCQDRAMATARATGTARPPPRPRYPARPPRPCPCRRGGMQVRPAPSTCTPSGTCAPGSGPRLTHSTGHTTR